jgi:hypothetical protein
MLIVGVCRGHAPVTSTTRSDNDRKFEYAHPLHHAAIVAIDMVAAWDRATFPNTIPSSSDTSASTTMTNTGRSCSSIPIHR